MVDVLAALKTIRTKEDIKLPDCPNLRKTTRRRGEDVPLVLRPYQLQMILHLISLKRFVVGDDTGLGKTVETIAALCHVWRKKPDTKVFVITKKSSAPQWVSEFERFTTGVRVFSALGGPEVRRKAREEWIRTDGPVVLVQGYTSACNDFSELQDLDGITLVLDEATAFKNPSTRVHKVIRAISTKADRVWGLTATLLKNNLMEGYGVYRVVEPSLFPMGETAFRDNYCIVEIQRVGQDRHIPVIRGSTGTQIARFREAIDGYYLGRLKHDVAKDLPILESKTIRVGLSNFQREKYAESVRGILEHGDGEIREFTETKQMTSLIYCQEIVNHPGLIGFPDYASEKLDALVELVTDGDFADEKVIVYTRFAKMVDLAEKALKKAGVKSVRVTGAESEAKRKIAMDTFQDEDSAVKVIFITGAGGEAINLQAAKALVFFDVPWSAGDYIQILGRMIRIGSINDRCYAIHLVAKDTIDEVVLRVMRAKMALIEAVLGERVKGVKGKDVHYTGSSMKEIASELIASLRKSA